MSTGATSDQFLFSGATLGKSVNRMIATLGGGALSIGVCRLATVFGNTGKAIVIDIFVFAIGIAQLYKRTKLII